LTDAARNAAAVLIEERWREHRVALRINAMIQMNEAREERRQIVAAERAAQEDRNALDRLLEGAVARVWPVVREVLIVMSCAVTVVLVAPEAFSTLPLAFDVRDGDDPWQQMRAASLGAAIAVSAFAALFLALVLLYVHTCTRMLYALHSLWIGSLIGGPLVALLPRLCQAAGAPLDVFTLAFLAWNVTVPGLVVVHWSATARRFVGLRRGYALLLSVGCAWLLASVPYQSSVAALLMLALLDVVLVSFPGSPVQRLDAIARERRAAGEPQMPGLVSKHDGLELGLGDFIVYSAFAAHAARSGAAPLLAVTVGVLGGLTVTMMHVALARTRTVVPALPLSIALGALMLAAERFVIHPLAGELSRGPASIHL